jgi:hypothetical protein
MDSGLMFILATLIFAVVLVFVVFKTPANVVGYFKTKEGLGVLKGIVLFILVGIVLVFASKTFSEENWLTYGEVFLGVDNTFAVSPNCLGGGLNDRLTSNGGVRLNLYKSSDGKFEWNTQYTHHSCAFNVDREGYDAIGMQMSYKLWDRRN